MSVTSLSISKSFKKDDSINCRAFNLSINIAPDVEISGFIVLKIQNDHSFKIDFYRSAIIIATNGGIFPIIVVIADFITADIFSKLARKIGIELFL